MFCFYFFISTNIVFIACISVSVNFPFNLLYVQLTTLRCTRYKYTLTINYKLLNVTGLYWIFILIISSTLLLEFIHSFIHAVASNRLSKNRNIYLLLYTRSFMFSNLVVKFVLLLKLFYCFVFVVMPWAEELYFNVLVPLQAAMRV